MALPEMREGYQEMTNKDNEGVAHEIIDKTLPLATTLGAYAHLFKAIKAALDEKDALHAHTSHELRQTDKAFMLACETLDRVNRPTEASDDQ